VLRKSPKLRGVEEEELLLFGSDPVPVRPALAVVVAKPAGLFPGPCDSIATTGATGLSSCRGRGRKDKSEDILHPPKPKALLEVGVVVEEEGEDAEEEEASLSEDNSDIAAVTLPLPNAPSKEDVS
jgi:hypothetical protein